MHIEWNKVTWYSMVVAVVLYATTFLFGAALGAVLQQALDASFYAPTVTEPITPEVSDNHYRNKDFGIEFDMHPVGGPIKIENNVLTGSLSGSIERFDIPERKNIRDTILDLVDQELGDVDNPKQPFVFDRCYVTATPWLPNEINDVTPGQVAVRLHAFDEVKFMDKAHADMIKAFGNDYIALEERDQYVAAATKACSRFVTIGDYRGYFLYDPINAPNRMYFVDDGYHGGEASFYTWPTVRVLPDNEL